MFGEKDPSTDLPCDGENSVSSKFSRVNRVVLDQSKGNPDDKTTSSKKGLDFLRESNGFREGSSSNQGYVERLLDRISNGVLAEDRRNAMTELQSVVAESKAAQSAFGATGFPVICENPKLVSSLPDKILMNSFEKFTTSSKGKEVVVENSNHRDEKWVERDFLNLNDSRVNSASSKREAGEDDGFVGQSNNTNNTGKKPKLEETLNLSLSLPDVSLSLTASNGLQNNVEASFNRPKPTRSLQSLAPSKDNTCSNDLTTASLSCSYYSHPFSHNPSCSLTHNSTENYDYSVGRDDHLWCGGEGTNGSVHSRFKPIGDGVVALNNTHGGGGGCGGCFSSRVMNKNDSFNSSLYKTTSSGNISFFPSELPARPRLDTNSGDSRKRDSDKLRGFESVDGGNRTGKLSRPGRVLREIVLESIPDVSQMVQELPEETLELVKEYLKNLVKVPEKREELESLQSRLERRSDLTKETLLKCHKNQLNLLVSIRTGLTAFLSEKIQLPINELVEIFCFMRCRNVNCKSLLPVDDCDCKICSKNKGFCSSCMCSICLNFDCANNTCSWVGCDVCSHWCHADCGIQKNRIKPGQSIKGPTGTSEMQFHCIGCGHASEMFGFVKDVFLYCAKDWGLETLVKELDCVRKIFKGSDDYKGKELHAKADELVKKLESKMMSPSDARSCILCFFNRPETMSHYPTASATSLSGMMSSQNSLITDATPIPLKHSSLYNMTPSSGRPDSSSDDPYRREVMGRNLKIDDELDCFGSKLPSKSSDGFDSLESIVRIKLAEARMFQGKADDARREAEEFKRMIRANMEKLEDEYAQKLANLCLQETEEKRRKKLEELKVLEDSHCDYYKMKLRMQAEIAGLLERMEATKQQLWV